MTELLLACSYVANPIRDPHRSSPGFTPHSKVINQRCFPVYVVRRRWRRLYGVESAILNPFRGKMNYFCNGSYIS